MNLIRKIINSLFYSKKVQDNEPFQMTNAFPPALPEDVADKNGNSFEIRSNTNSCEIRNNTNTGEIMSREKYIEKYGRLPDFPTTKWSKETGEYANWD